MPTSYYSTSVQEALRAGRLHLLYIPRALLFISFGIYGLFFFTRFFQAFNMGDGGRLFFSNNLYFIALPFGGWFLAVIWRWTHSASWKIWALENVKDIHRLYQLAENKGMINKRDSWFNRFEYKTFEQRELLADLERRLDQPRQMEGAQTIGDMGEREIKYSWKKALLQFAFILPGLAIFAYVTKKVSFFPIGLFALFFVGVILFQWLPRLGKPAPIRLNNKGLQIKDSPEILWKQVTGIYLENRKKGKSNVDYLVVEAIATPPHIEIELSDLEGSSGDIEQILYDYWVKGK